MDTQPPPRKTAIQYRVPYADTDQMGFVYYANYLVYFERVRNELLRDQYVPYKEIEGRGYLLPAIEAHCFYHSPAGYDDLLEISGWFEKVGAIRVRVHCEVRRNDVLLASGYTMHVCLDARTRKPTRLPADFPGVASKKADASS